MDGPRDCHTEWGKLEEKYLWYSLCAESKKRRYQWTSLQNRNRLTDLENELMVAEGKDGEIDMYKLLYLKWITI